MSATPTCPHCCHAMTTDEMVEYRDVSLFDLAHQELREAIKCPACDLEYWVQGGYVPTYTSAYAEEDL